jgi:hypothetical protein
LQPSPVFGTSMLFSGYSSSDLLVISPWNLIYRHHLVPIP